MGQHREKSAQREDKFAWMREQQRLKKQRGAREQTLAVERERATRFSERAERKLARLKEKADREAAREAGAVDGVAGFTWGKPLPRRTKAELKRVWRDHRRGKNPPKPRTKGCRCGNCPECAHRVAYTEYVRNKRKGTK